MYRKKNLQQYEFEDFYLPFSGNLRSDNRWVILSKQIPWDDIEAKYSNKFAGSKTGNPALSSRIALGSLIIKERMGTSDRETVDQITENPYLQYFLGFSEYTEEKPFDASLMTHFRKRFDKETLSEINDMIVREAMATITETEDDESGDGDDDDDNDTTGSNKGKLLIDSTCTPADIAYPTDLNLLNDAREKTEDIIDTMHQPRKGINAKPRTYRMKARKEYLAVAKQKRPGAKKIRKGIGKQLRYLRRNLKHIDNMASAGLLQYLSKRQYRNLLVISELYRQQKIMFDNRTHRMQGRIVSITQPHVRPIVRGKAKTPVEFGAKISVSMVDGFSFVDNIGWEPFNESADLIPQIESYHKKYGNYPKSVHVDKIYRTRENLRYCKDKGIRLCGPPLGRPKKPTEHNIDQLKKEQRLQREDELARIPIEGKFGQAKRRFTLSRIMAKLAETSEAVTMIAFIAMNLEKILQTIIYFVLYSLCYARKIAIKTMRTICRLLKFTMPSTCKFANTYDYAKVAV